MRLRRSVAPVVGEVFSPSVLPLSPGSSCQGMVGRINPTDPSGPTGRTDRTVHSTTVLAGRATPSSNLIGGADRRAIVGWWPSARRWSRALRRDRLPIARRYDRLSALPRRPPERHRDPSDAGDAQGHGGG